MMSPVRGQKKTTLSQRDANPFAFQPEKYKQATNGNMVEYLSPQKRRQMKEYLSNSSISLANG